MPLPRGKGKNPKGNNNPISQAVRSLVTKAVSLTCLQQGKLALVKHAGYRHFSQSSYPRRGAGFPPELYEEMLQGWKTKRERSRQAHLASRRRKRTWSRGVAPCDVGEP